MSVLDRKKRVRQNEGWLEYYSAPSKVCPDAMSFSVYLPPQAETQQVPVIYWLSGLTCTEDNFMVKAGAFKKLAELGIALVAPDTSPRGAGIEGEDDSWDFGTGAGFYLNATQPKWARHYNMYDYVNQELPMLVETLFNVIPGKKSIMGHSMGGHGAMVLAFREVGKYAAVSAFAPICAPSQCPWGQKAFRNYLGNNKSDWASYDSNELVRTTDCKLPLLIDQGTNDDFLNEQLMPEIFQNSCDRVSYPLTLRMQEGYDHSYHFISSFIDDHIEHHAKGLKA